MKIIKEGELKPKETKKTCSKCKTKFSFTSEDIKPDWGEMVIMLIVLNVVLL